MPNASSLAFGGDTTLEGFKRIARAIADLVLPFDAEEFTCRNATEFDLTQDDLLLQVLIRMIDVAHAGDRPFTILDEGSTFEKVEAVLNDLQMTWRRFTPPSFSEQEKAWSMGTIFLHAPEESMQCNCDGLGNPMVFVTPGFTSRTLYLDAALGRLVRDFELPPLKRLN